MKRFLPLVIIVAVLITAVVATWLLLRSARTDQSSQSSTNTSSSEAPGADPPHIRGNPKAPVTLEEFGDFECPACGTYSVELKKIESEFGDRLRVIFREYPLYPTPHKHALIAAQAAEAAGLQSRFWEMHDKLYENQKAWSEAADVMPLIIAYAREMGLDTDRFGRDLNGEIVATRITQDGIRGHARAITVTPSFFVNGKEAKGESWKPEGLREMINAALRGNSSP
jgi:protein-disulfide isomerase